MKANELRNVWYGDDKSIEQLRKRVKQYRISTAHRYIMTCRLDKDKY